MRVRGATLAALFLAACTREPEPLPLWLDGPPVDPPRPPAGSLVERSTPSRSRTVTRRATAALTVRSRPDAGASRRGTIASGATFAIEARGASDDRCPEQGWARLADGAWACLDPTVPGGDPTPWPPLVRYAPPRPVDFQDYRTTGAFPARDAVDLPFVYAQRIYGRQGRVWEDLDAWNRGDPSVRRAGTTHYVGVRDTPRGTVLLEPDGDVVPWSEVWVRPISRQRGRDLGRERLPGGTIPAWAVALDGVPVRSVPSTSGRVERVVPYGARLTVEATPQGRWWHLWEGGHVEESRIRRWIDLPPPRGVGEDEVWVDVDVSQQTLAVRRGSRLEWFTLVSTGVSGHRTPRGVYRATDKTVLTDMASLPGSSEPYHVDDVPWTVHFLPRYALHGAYWHWKFGYPVSHGCVNLAPLDAREVFERVGPTLPTGWASVQASAERPGAVVRIRDGAHPPTDRR